MPTRKPLTVRHTGATSFQLQQHALFPAADRYAAKILVETVTHQNGADEMTDEALYALMRQSRFYKPALETAGQIAGDLMNACFDAGLLLGLAFGLRLRGAA